MAKTKQQKQETIKQLAESLKNSKGSVFADYTGLKVSEMQELRAKLGESNSHLVAARKTLLKIALKDSGLENIDISNLSGAVSAATSSEDEVAPAKAMAEFAKTHDALRIQGGILENNFIDAARVSELAKLPAKPELLAKIVGSIQAPVSGFVNVLRGNLMGLVRVLNNIRETKV